MNTARTKLGFVLLAFWISVTLGVSQEQTAEHVEHGMVDAGTRWSWGHVYGRPDLPFSPDLKTSKYNEYRDLRDGFFVRRFRFSKDDIAGSKYY